MTWSVSTAARNDMADAVDARVNAGAGTAVIEIRSGGKPASPDNAATGTLLASFSLPNPAFGAAATGTITLNGVPISATVAATGTAGYARIKDRDGNGVVDGTVTAAGGGGDIIVQSTSFVSGTTARITAGTLTQPG